MTNWLKTSLQSVGLNVSFLFPSCPDAMLFSYKCLLPVFPIRITTFLVLSSADYQNRIYDSLTQIMFPLTISEEILFHNGLLSLQKIYINPWNSPAPTRPTEEQINSYLLRSPWWRTSWSWQFTTYFQQVMRKQDCYSVFFFSWLHHVACGILVPLTRDRTHAPCSGSVEF